MIFEDWREAYWMLRCRTAGNPIPSPGCSCARYVAPKRRRRASWRVGCRGRRRRRRIRAWRWMHKPLPCARIDAIAPGESARSERLALPVRAGFPACRRRRTAGARHRWFRCVHRKEGTRSRAAAGRDTEAPQGVPGRSGCLRPIRPGTARTPNDQRSAWRRCLRGVAPHRAAPPYTHGSTGRRSGRAVAGSGWPHLVRRSLP